MRKGLCVFAAGAVLVFLMSAAAGRSAARAGSQSQAQAGQLTHLGNIPQAISAPEKEARQAPAIRSIPPGSQKIKVDADYGKMPVYFIPNRGQLDKQVAYYVQGKDKSLYFTEEGVTIALTKPVPSKGAKPELLESGPDRSKATKGECWVLKLDFVGAAKGVKPVGEDETGAVVSYFKGKQKDWKTGLPTYSKIVYRDLWPGIDLVYYGTVNRLKYEFIVHPGADPSEIRLAYRGVDSLSVDNTGRLNVRTSAGSFQDDFPVAIQGRDGKPADVGLAYVLEPHPATRSSAGEHLAEGNARRQVENGPSAQASHAYGFKVGDYDHTLPLVLDPAFLIYCGYIGGSMRDYGGGIAVDASGYAYVVGQTESPQATFPVTVGPDLTYNYGGYDAFVAKVNAAGTALVYCGYIGGSSEDDGVAIAVDGSGNAFVSGYTASSEATFPVTVGPDLTYNGGTYDAFVAKVNAAGTALVYCGYIGGSSGDVGRGIAVDGSGNAYVGGFTASSEATFPVTVGPNLTQDGGSDAFVAKVNTTGTGLVYCGYIGGSSEDYVTGIAVDGSGNAYVGGSTASSEATFPVTVGPDLTYNGGAFDGFVAKVNAAGTGLVYCGYIGGSSGDYVNGIAVDGSGNAYVGGSTASSEATFPVTVGPDLTYNGGDSDAFVAKISTSGTGFVYCGYIGGSSGDVGRGIAVDGSGNAYVIGFTDSTEATFPLSGGPNLKYSDNEDAFAAKVNASGAALVYCGYIGGSSFDYGFGIAVDGSGNAYLVGQTYSHQDTFPVAVGPDLTHNGFYDAFIAKLCYFDERIPKWAVSDVDGDLKDEVAVDFGTAGIWLYDQGSWAQIAPENPESLAAHRLYGSYYEVVMADLGSKGLYQWSWYTGIWTQFSGADVESMAFALKYIGGGSDGDWILVGAFGTLGLWSWPVWDGLEYWGQLSGANADYVTTVRFQTSAPSWIIGDFGALGMWGLSGAGAWSELSGANADYMTGGRWLSAERLVADFGSLGLWTYTQTGGWIQLTGANPDFIIAADTNADGNDEIVGDFGSLGLWLYDGGWTELSALDAVYMVRADVDGDGRDEIVVDFGSKGLWLWNNGTWSKISASISEYLVAADTNGDGKQEILSDFGALGLWMWDQGVWTKLSPNNPD
jgi:hypothetical protein